MLLKLPTRMEMGQTPGIHMAEIKTKDFPIQRNVALESHLTWLLLLPKTRSRKNRLLVKNHLEAIKKGGLVWSIFGCEQMLNRLA